MYQLQVYSLSRCGTYPERCKFESCSGEVYSIQHYVIEFVSDLGQVCGVVSSVYSGFLHQ